jgi:predicted GNAT family acetyltransferase
MEIKFEESESKGAFYTDEMGERLAEMTFSKAGNKLLIIDHTEVSETLKGKGTGKQLVAAAVEYARRNGVKIIPLCPFAKSVFDKTPDFKDVLNS